MSTSTIDREKMTPVDRIRALEAKVFGPQTEPTKNPPVYYPHRTVGGGWIPPGK